jgi:hypothetical protein
MSAVRSPGNRDKVSLVGGEERERCSSNKLPEQDCSPRVHPPPLDRPLQQGVFLAKISPLMKTNLDLYADVLVIHIMKIAP